MMHHCGAPSCLTSCCFFLLAVTVSAPCTTAASFSLAFANIIQGGICCRLNERPRRRWWWRWGRGARGWVDNSMANRKMWQLGNGEHGVRACPSGDSGLKKALPARGFNMSCNNISWANLDRLHTVIIWIVCNWGLSNVGYTLRLFSLSIHVYMFTCSSHTYKS